MKTLYKFVLGAALAATLVLAGCEDGATTVNFPTIKAPNVAVSAIPDGVKLEWDADIDAASYAVYRRQAGGADILLLGSILTDPETGKRVYRDLQSAAANSVKAAATYTYTVRVDPISDLKERAATKVTVATNETFLAKGDQLEPPDAVAIELLPESNQIKVTVTPGAHKDLLNRYYALIYRDGALLSGNATFYYPETTGMYNWTSAQQISGTYTARVQAIAGDSFHVDSKPIESEEHVFEPLFGPSFSITLANQTIVPGAAASITTVVNYSTRIAMSNFRTGVTYTVERAPADKLGNVAGDYAPVALSALVSGSGATGTYQGIPADEMTADSFGYLGRTEFYDRTLPAAAGSYVYRVKAVKGDATQYAPKTPSLLSIDPTTFVAAYLSVSVPSQNAPSTGIKRYSVTPSLSYKNLLPEGGKLVIYWMKGDLTAAGNGQYGSKIEFTKADLEASTPATAKYIDVSTAATGSVYARVYLEFADGTREALAYTVWQAGGQVEYRYYSTDNNGNRFDYARLVD